MAVIVDIEQNSSGGLLVLLGLEFYFYLLIIIKIIICSDVLEPCRPLRLPFCAIIDNIFTTLH